MITFAMITTWLLKYKKVLLYIGVGILVLVLIFSLRECFKKEPKIDIETVQKINSQNEAVRKEELKKVIEANSDVIKTVDERNLIVEEDIEQRDKEIDKKIEEIDKKIEEAKSQKGDVTQEELKCILIPQNCQ